MAISSEVLVRARDAPAYGRNFLTQDKTMTVANLMPISRLFHLLPDNFMYREWEKAPQRHNAISQ